MKTDKNIFLDASPKPSVRRIAKSSKRSKQSKLKKNLRSSVFICGLFFLFFAQVSAQTTIKIFADSKVKNETITLGDIAEISGENAQKIEQISLGYAPNIGMTREIPRARIALSIAAAGFSTDEFLLNAPQLIRLTRAGQKVDANLIRATVEKAVFDQFNESGIEVKIAHLDLPEKIDVPIGEIELRTNVSNVINPFAPFSLPLEIRVDGKVFRRLAVNVELEAFAEILVANKDLTTNAKLSKTDVRLEKRRLEKPPTNYLRDAENLRGLNLIKNLSNGAEITMDSVVASVVVKSGDLVRIVGQSGKMRITVNGEARTSGKIGDRIAVKNLQSNADIQATVVDEGFVKVSF